jgi:4-hydroxy-3-methylbut-2-enyl diphosphate reductase
MRHQKLGRHVVLIGHAGHPEVIGTMGQLPEGAVSLIETVADVDVYEPTDRDNLGYVTQTTLSVDDTAGVIARLFEKFPNLTPPSADSICYATTNRQEAVKHAAPGCDLFIVVGAPNSSNSKRLVEVALRAGATQSVLVQRAAEIDWDSIGPIATVGLSAGASAPEVIVDEIVEAFRERYNAQVELAITAEENEHFLVNRELRSIELTTADMAFVNGEAAV